MTTEKLTLGPDNSQHSYGTAWSCRMHFGLEDDIKNGSVYSEEDSITEISVRCRKCIRAKLECGRTIHEVELIDASVLGEFLASRQLLGPFRNIFYIEILLNTHGLPHLHTSAVVRRSRFRKYSYTKHLNYLILGKARYLHLCIGHRNRT